MPLTVPSHDAPCPVVLAQQCPLPDSAHWPLRCLLQSMLPLSLRDPEHLLHLRKSRPFLSRALTTSSWDLPHCLTLALIVHRNDNLWDSQGRCLTSVLSLLNLVCTCLVYTALPVQPPPWLLRTQQPVYAWRVWLPHFAVRGKN